MPLRILNNKWPFFIGLVLSLSAFFILESTLFFDQNNIVSQRIYEMDSCFKDGQIPCRWVPDMQNQYGYPLFNYHAPLPYYFGELIFYFTNNLSISAKIIFAVATICSYIFMYLNLKKLLGNKWGSLFSLFFTLALLMLIVYQRGEIGELWGIMFTAVALFLVSRLKEQINLKNLLLLGLSVAFMLTSYDFSIIIFLPIILILIVIVFFRKRQIKFLWFSLIAILLGVALSSFYLLPRIFESGMVNANYRPFFAKETPKKATARYEILTGEGSILDFKEGSNWISFKTDTSVHTIIRLSQYYFPNWKVFVDGKETPVDYKNNSKGLMTFILGEGNHVVEARFFDTRRRTLSNLITGVSFGITVILFFISFDRVRRWLLYYRKRIN